MELTIPRSELQRLLQVTESVVQKKTTMPILTNVLLTASDGKLKISASDFEVTVVSQCNAKVANPGSTTVNGKVFSEVVRELPDADIVLKLGDGERLNISCGSIRVKLNGVSADEYPSLPGMNIATQANFPAKDFLEMVHRTIYAVSLDETRFNLNGVCFELLQEGEGKKAKKSLRLVATDGHRLALITRPCGNLSFESSVIVPRKGLGELRKIVGDEVDRDIGIAVQDGFLVVDTGATKISMRLIEGQFPDYNQVIPKGKGVRVEIAGTELAQALRRVALVVSDKSKTVRFDLANNILRLSSSSPELGEAKEEVDITYKGEPLSIGFNARYLIDVVSALNDEGAVFMDLHGELGPGVFSSQQDSSCMGIVMPMRLS